MKFLAIENELKSDGFTEKILKAEAQAVWDLQKAGKIREIYFKKETKEAVLILECEGLSEAQNILNHLPLVKENLIEFSVSELQPYDGLDRLMK